MGSTWFAQSRHLPPCAGGLVASTEKANALLGVGLCGGQQEAGMRPCLLGTCHTPSSHRSLPVRQG